EALDKKGDMLEKKEESLNKKHQELENKKSNIENLYEKQREELERLAGLTSDQAKEMLLEEVRKEIKHETA
ncbi:ribonuclease Y, partial [Verrucosispora sp. ts21]